MCVCVCVKGESGACVYVCVQWGCVCARRTMCVCVYLCVCVRNRQSCVCACVRLCSACVVKVSVWSSFKDRTLQRSLTHHEERPGPSIGRRPLQY